MPYGTFVTPPEQNVPAAQGIRIKLSVNIVNTDSPIAVGVHPYPQFHVTTVGTRKDLPQVWGASVLFAGGALYLFRGPEGPLNLGLTRSTQAQD